MIYDIPNRENLSWGMRWENLYWGNTCDPDKNWDVSLARQGEEFQATIYRRRDNHLLTSMSLAILEGFSTDEFQKYLEKCEPTVEDEQTVTVFFSPSLYEETLDDSKVRCLKGRTHLVWQRYNPAKNSRIYMPFAEMRASARCADETAKRILELSTALQAQNARQTLKDYQCVLFTEESVIECASRIQLGATKLKEINCIYELAQAPLRKITLTLSTTSSVPAEFWKDSQMEFVPFFIPEDRGCSLLFLSSKKLQEASWNHLRSPYTTTCQATRAFSTGESVFQMTLARVDGAYPSGLEGEGQAVLEVHQEFFKVFFKNITTWSSPSSNFSVMIHPKKEITCKYELAQDRLRKITLELSTKSSVPAEFWKDSQGEFVPFFISEDRGCSLVLLSSEKLQGASWNHLRSPYTTTSQAKRAFSIGENVFQMTLARVDGAYPSGLEGEGQAVLEVYQEFFKVFFKNMKTWSSPSPKNVCVMLQPRSRPSFFDHHVCVTPFRWGVTLLNHNGSENNHALVQVEMIRDEFFDELGILNVPQTPLGSYISCNFHFTGEYVEIRYLPKIQFTGRTQVFLRPKEDVKRMLLQVKKAINNPPTFAFRGKGAACVDDDKSHSCATWAVEMLQHAKIVLVKSAISFLFTRTKNYTQSNPPPQLEQL
ncbi:MAG: hypothetical protein LLG04_17805 [Parachlamydia sp.]|nr:hypothetical protein [Parachlamydia sp.]